MDLDLDAIEVRAKAATPFPGYTVDRDGNVWSSQNWRGYGERKLTLFPNGHGYPSVKVCSQGKMKKALVHVMVCTAFHGPKPTEQHQVCHINGRRDDCRAENLRWGTAADNAADRKRHGTEMAAINGKASAWKAVGKRKTHCLRGHFKEGRSRCIECAREKRAAKREAVSC